MLKRLFVYFLCLVFSLLVIWGGMFGTDYYRCTQLKKPVFAAGVADSLYDDGGSGTYRGIGYEIEIEGELTVEYGYVAESIEMRLLDMLVFAAIT